MAHDHDHAYKLLFSHAQMVRDLLEGFVCEDWLAQLDYASLERVNGSYVTDDLRERADDIVWRVRWGADWMYVYLLIEFQSTVERYMAVRILTYVGLLYQDLIRGARLPDDGQLPPILPIVLYNGPSSWHAAHEMASLIQPGPRALDVYRPQMRYLLIDERQYRDSDLAPLRNLVAALFRLENSRTRAEIEEILRLLVDWLRTPEQENLRRAFWQWLKRVILPRLPDRQEDLLNESEEMRVGLAESIEDWKAGFRQEGREAGLKQGHREGEAQLLLRLLQKRFGELPEWVHLRVRSAEPEQLERWGERLLDVQSLDALFDGERAALPG